MADKAISELTAAEQITTADLFLLEQAGTAKKLTGQTLITFLTALADGHGGISSIKKISTKGLVDTYRITLADTTVFDFTVTNGAKGDKGDNAYTWIKYASQEPTESSHSMGDIPDKWMGVYAGSLPSAPDDWTLYSWFEIKGQTGDTGAPAVLVSASISYQVGTSAAEIPTGEWSTAIPETPQGSFLWSRAVYTFNTGEPVTLYSVSRNGVDGLGTLRTINGIEPDENGNITLSAANVGALAKTGDTLQGTLNANSNVITGLPSPSNDSDAVPYALVRKPTVTVWQNMAITSEFAAQTLSLNDSANKGNSFFARVYFLAGTDDQTMFVTADLPISTLATTYQASFLYVPSGATGGVPLTRNITITRKSSSYVLITFGSAYRNGTTENNSYLIPHWIDFIREVT